MASRRQLIVVSNRGPATYGRDESGARVTARGGGGLVTALRGLVRHHDVTWIASAISEEDHVVAEESAATAIEETGRDGSGYRLRLIAHDPAAYDGYYNVVSNPTLWFLQHYLWSLSESPNLGPHVHRAWAEGYVPVNASFAEAVLAELEVTPEATVFFHDYHLYLAPAFVREARPDAQLAQFVHIPWPQSDYWHVLHEPMRLAIHHGLLANDVVGFHTDRWSRNFLRTCADLVGADADPESGLVLHGGRRTVVTHRPISVDVDEFERLASSEAVLEEERRLVAVRPEHLVVRVDRTDPSKNIVRGFRAFELYLDAHPEMHGRVGMLALLDPSRQDIPEYADYLDSIQRAARAVNDRFEDGNWLPIDLRIQDNFPQSVAAYKQFDVLLVNAVFDGLNLVAKEAPLVNERDGVLVLSENAGAYEELSDWAVSVNPLDLSGQAEAIHRALSFRPEERRRRLAGIQAHVREHDVGAWIEALLGDFDRVLVAR